MGVTVRYDRVVTAVPTVDLSHEGIKRAILESLFTRPSSSNTTIYEHTPQRVDTAGVAGGGLRAGDRTVKPLLTTMHCGTETGRRIEPQLLHASAVLRPVS